MLLISTKEKFKMFYMWNIYVYIHTYAIIYTGYTISYVYKYWATVAFAVSIALVGQFSETSILIQCNSK